MITEDYVSFETAKLLKEKGFDEPCQTWYGIYQELNFLSEEEPNTNSSNRNALLDVACPTLQKAMKWLRLEHKLHIEPIPGSFDYKHGDIHDGWYCEITHLSDMSYDADYDSHKKHKTYEEACEAAIKYCLENLV